MMLSISCAQNMIWFMHFTKKQRKKPEKIDELEQKTLNIPCIFGQI